MRSEKKKYHIFKMWTLNTNFPNEMLFDWPKWQNRNRGILNFEIWKMVPTYTVYGCTHPISSLSLNVLSFSVFTIFLILAPKLELAIYFIRRSLLMLSLHNFVLSGEFEIENFLFVTTILFTLSVVTQSLFNI